MYNIYLFFKIWDHRDLNGFRCYALMQTRNGNAKMIVNLERHSFLLQGPTVTIWTVGWHWYWQPNGHPIAMHIHEPVTGIYLLPYPLYATGKRCAWVHRGIVSRRTRAKIIMRYAYSIRRIALKGKWNVANAFVR